ncbi:MAG: hypothetical protein ACYTBJ_05490 [Planctomycetota bacterium]
MIENLAKHVLYAQGSTTDRRRNSTVTLQLDICGRRLSFDICIPDHPAALADIVPVARAICTRITDAVSKPHTDMENMSPADPHAAPVVTTSSPCPYRKHSD